MRKYVLLLVCLLFQALAPACAQGQRIWVAVGGQDANSQALVKELRGRLPDRELIVRPWSEFVAESAPAPRVVVAVGADAMERMAAAATAWPKTTLVALLVPRANLERLAEDHRGRITGIYFDQPFPRMAQFLRLAMPERRRIGVLLGPNSQRYRSELVQALRRAGLEEVIATVEERDDLPQALRAVLDDSQVLVAIPDSVVHNSNTAHHSLLAAFRQGVPMVGYSASFVKAGAAMALVSTPEQIGRQGAALVADLLAGREVPAPQAPEEFEPMANANVTRSLGLAPDVEALGRQLAGKKRAP